jgi:hypothetical protein
MWAHLALRPWGMDIRVLAPLLYTLVPRGQPHYFAAWISLEFFARFGYNREIALPGWTSI